MPTVRQTSFSAGELDPKLWGRTDLPLFAKGLRRCRNFFVSQQGALVSRPGTVYLGETKGAGTTKAVRLVPFVYSDSQTYVLEFGHAYVRFWSNGAQVQAKLLAFDAQTDAFTVGTVATGNTSGATGTIISQTAAGGGVGTLQLGNVVGTYLDNETLAIPGAGSAATVNGAPTDTPLELATLWAETDLPFLQFVQTGDVLTVVSSTDIPKELARSAHTLWTLGDVSTGGYGVPTNAYLLASSLAVTSADRPEREWTYAVTGLWQDANGVVRESDALLITQTSTNTTWPGAGIAALGSKLVVYPDAAVTVWLPDQGFAAPAGWTRIGKRVYRGRGDVFGWLSDVGPSATSFTDVGQEPDYALPPPGDAPFALDGVSSVAYYQERRVFGGTPELPARIWLSATGNYFDFGLQLLGGGDQALEFEMASRQRETVRWLLGAESLLIGTDSNTWALDGGQGGALSFESYDLRLIDSTGTSYLPPLVFGSAVLYVAANSRAVRLLSPSARVLRRWEGSDLTTAAQHLFRGAAGQVVDWALAAQPYGLVWAVRADGKLLSLTFGEGGAWAWHDTDGEVQNVCAVPEDGEDAVYLVVKRTINGTVKRYIERMVDREPEGSDPVCVDCAKAVVYTAGTLTQLTGLSHLEAKSVYVVAHGKPVWGPLTVTGGAVPFTETPSGATTFYVGLLYTPEGETLDVAQGEARMRQKVVERVGIEVYASRGLAVGPDLDHLVEWRQRQVSDSYNAISAATELVTIVPGSGYSNHARIAFRQTQPLPLTVVGLSRALSLGE